MGCCNHWGTLFNPGLCLVFSNTLLKTVPPFVCLLLVRNAICFELEWVRMTHVVAASRSGLRGPRGVLTGANVCYGYIKAILQGNRCAYHKMRFPLFHTLASWFTWHGTRSINRDFLRERQGTAWLCSVLVFIRYVLICLFGRVVGFLPGWSNGFSSAWWTSSGPASPSASPRSEAVPPGSRLQDRQ